MERRVQKPLLRAEEQLPAFTGEQISVEMPGIKCAGEGACSPPRLRRAPGGGAMGRRGAPAPPPGQDDALVAGEETLEVRKQPLGQGLGSALGVSSPNSLKAAGRGS